MLPSAASPLLSEGWRVHPWVSSAQRAPPAWGSQASEVTGLGSSLHVVTGTWGGQRRGPGCGWRGSYHGSGLMVLLCL